MITPQNVVRHELIGLRVKVAYPPGTKPSSAEATGKVVDETRNTLTVESAGKEKVFIKDQCTFSFYLPGPKKWVRVRGDVIVARPEDRIKKRLKSW